MLPDLGSILLYWAPERTQNSKKGIRSEYIFTKFHEFAIWFSFIITLCRFRYVKILSNVLISKRWAFLRKIAIVAMMFFHTNDREYHDLRYNWTWWNLIISWSEYTKTHNG